MHVCIWPTPSLPKRGSRVQKLWATERLELAHGGAWYPRKQCGKGKAWLTSAPMNANATQKRADAIAAPTVGAKENAFIFSICHVTCAVRLANTNTKAPEKARSPMFYFSKRPSAKSPAPAEGKRASRGFASVHPTASRARMMRSAGSRPSQCLRAARPGPGPWPGRRNCTGASPRARPRQSARPVFSLGGSSGPGRLVRGETHASRASCLRSTIARCRRPRCGTSSGCSARAGSSP